MTTTTPYLRPPVPNNTHTHSLVLDLRAREPVVCNVPTFSYYRIQGKTCRSIADTGIYSELSDEHRI